MEISVDYMDGRVVEFNTSDFVASDPFKKQIVRDDPKASNVVTEFQLRLDLLAEEGLRMDVYYYTMGSLERSDSVDLTDELGERQGGGRWVVPAGTRRVEGVIYLLNKDDLEGAAYILVRRCSETIPVAWRQGSGNWLIDGMRFSRTAREVYSDSNITSRNQQESVMMRYLHDAYPSLPEEELAGLTGYPYAAWQEIQEMEGESFDDAAGDDGGGLARPDDASEGGPGGEESPGDGGDGDDEYEEDE